MARSNALAAARHDATLQQVADQLGADRDRLQRELRAAHARIAELEAQLGARIAMEAAGGIARLPGFIGD
jgi:phage shock protein A